MKPVAICRFAPHEGPGYFATYLTAREMPWRLVTLDTGAALPAPGTFSALAMMGGGMSVNDDLPWIRPMLDLIRGSVEAGVPVIGHCLGGQLLSKALGGQVTANPVKEIGWADVRALATASAPLWGPTGTFLSYHWHGETFSVPAGAQRIWSSAHCANQAFVTGNSIGMQCHVEMTESMIADWCESGRAEIEQSIHFSPAVQTPGQMCEDLAAKLEALHGVADSVYDRWVKGVTNR